MFLTLADRFGENWRVDQGRVLPVMAVRDSDRLRNLDTAVIGQDLPVDIAI